MLATYCIVYLLNFIDITSVGGVLVEEEKRMPTAGYYRLLSKFYKTRVPTQSSWVSCPIQVIMKLGSQVKGGSCLVGLKAPVDHGPYWVEDHNCET